MLFIYSVNGDIWEQSISDRKTVRITVRDLVISIKSSGAGDLLIQIGNIVFHFHGQCVDMSGTFFGDQHNKAV